MQGNGYTLFVHPYLGVFYLVFFQGITDFLGDLFLFHLFRLNDLGRRRPAENPGGTVIQLHYQLELLGIGREIPFFIVPVKVLRRKTGNLLRGQPPAYGETMVYLIRGIDGMEHFILILFQPQVLIRHVNGESHDAQAAAGVPEVMDLLADPHPGFPGSDIPFREPGNSPHNGKTVSVGNIHFAVGVPAIGCGVLLAPLVNSGIPGGTVGDLENPFQLPCFTPDILDCVGNLVAQLRLLNSLLTAIPLDNGLIHLGDSPEFCP